MLASSQLSQYPGGTRRAWKWRATVRATAVSGLSEGVPSGSYELHAESPAGTLAFAGTQIAAGRISVVRLQLSAVSVSGISTCERGAGVPDVSLLFISDDAPAPVAVSTDALGIYSVRLATAGKYLVSFRHSHAVFEPLEVTLVLGENVIDHDVSGGAATIKLDGWNQQSPVVVRFRSKRGRRDVVVSPGQAAEHTVTALPLGSYEVTAFQDGGWATRQPEFVMIEDNSDQPSIGCGWSSTARCWCLWDRTEDAWQVRTSGSTCLASSFRRLRPLSRALQGHTS